MIMKRECFKIHENIDIIMEIYYKGLGDFKARDIVRKTMLEVILGNFNKYLFDPSGDDIFTEEEIGRILSCLYDDFPHEWRTVMSHFSSPSNDLEDIVDKLTKVMSDWVQNETMLVNMVTTSNYWEISRLTGDFFIITASKLEP